MQVLGLGHAGRHTRPRVGAERTVAAEGGQGAHGLPGGRVSRLVAAREGEARVRQTRLGTCAPSDWSEHTGSSVSSLHMEPWETAQSGHHVQGFTELADTVVAFRKGTIAGMYPSEQGACMATAVAHDAHHLSSTGGPAPPRPARPWGPGPARARAHAPARPGRPRRRPARPTAARWPAPRAGRLLPAGGSGSALF